MQTLMGEAIRFLILQNVVTSELNMMLNDDGNLPSLFTPLTIQPPSFFKGSDLEVKTTIYCISLQVRFGFASNARAHIPAAKGAEAEVPKIEK